MLVALHGDEKRDPYRLAQIVLGASRLTRWTLAMLLGAALGGVSAAQADVSFERTDIALAGRPDSVALGDLDGRNGQDIVMAFTDLGAVGVMLNRGDGTFGPPTAYTAGPGCAGQLVDLALGDVTPTPPDGRLDAFVVCTPSVVRLTGDGAGALGNPTAFNLNLPPYLGAGTVDFIALMRRRGRSRSGARPPARRAELRP